MDETTLANQSAVVRPETAARTPVEYVIERGGDTVPDDAPDEEPQPTLEELIQFIEDHGGRLGPIRWLGQAEDPEATRDRHQGRA